MSPCSHIETRKQTSGPCLPCTCQKNKQEAHVVCKQNSLCSFWASLSTTNHWNNEPPYESCIIFLAGFLHISSKGKKCRGHSHSISWAFTAAQGFDTSSAPRRDHLWLSHMQKHPEPLSNQPSLSVALRKHRVKIILTTRKNWRGREGKKPKAKALNRNSGGTSCE